jgi:hypothetical protein
LIRFYSRNTKAGRAGELESYLASRYPPGSMTTGTLIFLGFGEEKVLTGSHAVETDKPHDPVQVGSLGVNGIVVQTEYLSDLIEEFWLLTHAGRRQTPPLEAG